MGNRLHIALSVALAWACAGCHSSILPLRPVQRAEVWVEEDTPAPETQPAATTPASLPADAQPATRPGRMVLKTIDPNQTSRFIYSASYDNVWRQAILILNDTGFAIDRQDYRLGVLTTRPLPSAQIVEFWKPEHVRFIDALENTVNNQRRIIRLTIARVEGKPDFHEIAVQVLVERQTNPTETIGGPIFVEGSGFGRNTLTLRSDYAAPDVQPGRWAVIGRDPNLERRVLDELFQRI